MAKIVKKVFNWLKVNYWADFYNLKTKIWGPAWKESITNLLSTKLEERQHNISII